MTDLLMASLSSNSGVNKILNGIMGNNLSNLTSQASDFMEGFLGFLGGFAVLYAICSVVVLCYFGYCAFRTILAINGFVSGAALGAVIGLVIATKNMEFDSIGGYIIIGALIVGIIGGVLASLLYKLGVFFFFSSGTFLIVFLNIMFGFGGKFGPSMVASVIIGFIVGIIAVIVDKYFIIAGTATIGACNGGILIMMMNTNGPMGLITALILLVSGIIVQVKLTQKLAGGIKVGRRGKADERSAAPVSSAPVTCPECGVVNVDPGMFCKNCSSRLPRPAAKKSAPTTGPVCTCVSCGHTNPAGLMFCAKCGYRLEQASRVSTFAELSSAPTTSQKPSLLDRLSDGNNETAKNLRRCPNCGAMVTAFGKTCEKCYQPFDEDEEKSPAPTFQPAQGSIAPDFGTPAYTTPNSAPDLSTAPVNIAPDYSTAPIAAIRCPGCGNPSEPGERFCSSCGRPLN